jgi:hypothetical protein
MGLLGRLARVAQKGLLGAPDPNARQPVFYSALNEAIRTHPMKEASPDQWLGTIKNLPGVKAEELQWSKIGDYLNERADELARPGRNDPNASISRDEIYKYLEDASKRYAPDEFYMTSRGDYANKEEWLNSYRTQDQISEEQSRRISDEWFFGHSPDWEPEISVIATTPTIRPSDEIAEELAQARVPGRWNNDRVMELEAELRGAQAREARDPLTPDIFTGQRDIDNPTGPPVYRARISGGYGDLDETLDEFFPDEDDAREAADQWIRNWRRNDGWFRFEEDALNNNTHYDDIVQEMLENNEPNFGTAFEDYALKGGKDYEELLITLPNLDGERAGTHWDDYVDEPVVAHVRYDTRVVDGKKILAIQEVQSDWHQQGRQRGYEGQFPPEQIEAAHRRRVELLDQSMQAQRAQRDVVRNLPDTALAKIAERVGLPPDEVAQGFPYLRTGRLPEGSSPMEYQQREMLRVRTDQLIEYAANHPSYLELISPDAPDAAKALRTLKQESDALKLAHQEADIAYRQMRGGTPDAPFKNNVWAAMVMKRMARMAADNGYDEIAWSGKIKNGSVREGQKGSDFYDKILVNEVNKLAKKSGVQVGSRNMSGFDWNNIQMTPEFIEFMKNSVPLFMWPLLASGAAIPALTGGGGLLGMSKRNEESA